MTPLAMLASALAPVALLAGSWPIIRRRYRLPTPADEIRHAVTRDGWDLALYRYRPSGPCPDREPVILCHGMLSNRFNVDLDERASLARYLRSRGFDCWVMELRGHGGSRRTAGENGDRPRASFDWNLDDYIQTDVPAVLDHVLEATNREKAHWLGYSMGGMVLYAACAAGGTGAKIRSAVLCDAPASFAPLRSRTRARAGRLYGRIFPAVPPALVLPLLGPIAWLHPGVLRRYGLRGRRLVMSVLSNAIIPWGSSRALLQFCEMLESGRFRSAGGSIDYEQGASRVDFPLLVLSAERKAIDERAVACGYERAPTREKSYVRLPGYTHSNLLISEASRTEIFPKIAEWFERH